VTFDVATTSSSYILINSQSGAVTDLAGNPVATGVVVAASNGNSTIDLSTLQAILPLQYWGMRIYGSTGNDMITGTNNMEHIIGGEGQDIINSGWGNDVINLSETTPAQDIVMVASNNGGNSSYYSPDIVYHFDVSSATAANHDVLGYGVASASNIISTGATANGSIGGITVASYTVSNGIITFEDGSNNTILINSNNYHDAVNYLDPKVANYTIAGIRFDQNNDGTVDSLAVFQKDSNNDDSVIILDGLTTATLGTSAGANVVQVADKIGPEINGVNFVNDHQFSLLANEIVASTTLTDAANTQMYIGTGSTLGNGFDGTVTGAGSDTLTIDTGSNTFTTGQYIVIASTGTTTLTDAAGNAAPLFESNEAGIAIGNTATASIDISALTGDYSIFNGLSTVGSTLTGNAGNNDIEGGMGGLNDTIIGGAGADRMRGNGGQDTFIFHAGDSTAVVWHNTNTNAGLNDGDTFTFANGADTIDMQDLSSGSKSTIQLDTASTLGSLNSADGTVRDDQYALIKGWYDSTSGVFNVNTANGNDTLVVYDGTAGSGVSQTAFVVTNLSSNMTLDTSVAHTISYTVI
jgi:hypothetical protein